MYLLEWGAWQMSLETAEKRKEMEAEEPPAIRRIAKDSYESDFPEAQYKVPASEQPCARGPVYAFNDTYLEMRCGAMEEKRGLITMGSVFLGWFFCAYLIEAVKIFYAMAAGTRVFEGTYYARFPTFGDISTATVLLSIALPAIYLYFKYAFRFTRLEMLTSRHLLVRFNRKTRQVHLHRPASCGGIVTLPWEATNCAAADPVDDPLSLGLRMGLLWHPIRTGLPHLEVAMVGQQGQGGSELRDEWEFIRRYMEDGPQGLPRPRLTSHFPWPWQAFVAQFEGIGNFVRKSGWAMKLALVLISPAFVIIGIAHWLSLLLCWKPRWPKVIREAGQPGKPVPKLTTLDDYPPDVRERLLTNADRWAVKPGQRPEKRPRASRRRKAVRRVDRDADSE
jgi:hypothetical protein